jgi:cytochrome c oxidase subunit 2
MRKIFASAVAATASLASVAAYAAQPTPWQTTFQPAATGIMEQITWFEHYTLWFIVPITLFVLVLLAYCIFKFRASANPVPSRTSHNTLIEVIWTVGPVVILLFLAIPSFQLLTAQYSPPEDAKLTIKATANQWNWDYEYQNAEPLSFNSAMLADADRAAAGKEDRAAYPRLLAVDNEIVVPINTLVRVLVTAADVIHAFAMPAFGVKTTRCRVVSTRSGSRLRRKASITASAPSFAARTTPTCRSPSASSPTHSTIRGLPPLRPICRRANKALMAETDGAAKVASAGN